MNFPSWICSPSRFVLFFETLIRDIDFMIQQFCDPNPFRVCIIITEEDHVTSDAEEYPGKMKRTPCFSQIQVACVRVYSDVFVISLTFGTYLSILEVVGGSFCKYWIYIFYIKAIRIFFFINPRLYDQQVSSPRFSFYLFKFSLLLTYIFKFYGFLQNQK